MKRRLEKKKLVSIFRNKIIAVFVSNYLKEKTSNLYLFNRKYIIENFLSRSFVTKKVNYKRKPVFIWSVQRKKGVNETINLWINKIFPKNQIAKLYIFGIDKREFNHKKYLYKKKNIFFFGRVPKRKLRTTYNKSLAMICLGYDETFCLNALEANSCGLPIITFGKTALKEFSINNKNSFILNNYTEIEKKILDLSKKKIDKKIILNSINHSKKYEINNITNKWINLFKMK